MNNVAPPAGAWIETNQNETTPFAYSVAPPAGAWIETTTIGRSFTKIDRRAPRGRVD